MLSYLHLKHYNIQKGIIVNKKGNKLGTLKYILLNTSEIMITLYREIFEQFFYLVSCLLFE